MMATMAITPVIGLFEDGPSADEALRKLHDLDLDDDALTVIDQASLDLDAPPGTAEELEPDAPGRVRLNPTHPLLLRGMGTSAARDVPADLHEVLADLGVSDESVRFYADGLRGGGHLIIADVDEAKADEVQEIMHTAGAVEYS